MDVLLKKLNYKDGQPIHCLNAPQSFIDYCNAVDIPLICDIKSMQEVYFALAFATTQDEVNAAADLLVPCLQGDAVVWFCYPKMSSKKYKCAFNRDTGWEAVGKHGLEPVRQVSIDEDWSALRFRKVAFIKTMTRNFAVSTEAKQRLGLD